MSRPSPQAWASWLAGVSGAILLVVEARPAALLQALETVWPWVVAAILLSWMAILLGAAAVAGDDRRLTPRTFAEQLRRTLTSRVNLTGAFIGPGPVTNASASPPGGSSRWATFTTPALLLMVAGGVALTAVVPAGSAARITSTIPVEAMLAAAVALGLGSLGLATRRAPGSAHSVAWAEGAAASLGLRRRSRPSTHRHRLGALPPGIAAQFLAAAGFWVLVRPLYAALEVRESEILLAALVLAAAWHFSLLLGALVPAAAGVGETILTAAGICLGLPLADALSVAIAHRVVEAVPTLAGWVLLRLDRRATGGARPAEPVVTQAALGPPRAMPTRAVVLLPARRDDPPGGAWAAATVAGLPLVERCVRGLARAGVKEVICWSGDAAATGLSKRLERRVESAARKGGVRLSWVTKPAGIPTAMLAADSGAPPGAEDGSREVIVVPGWACFVWRALRDAARSGAGAGVPTEGGKMAARALFRGRGRRAADAGAARCPETAFAAFLERFENGPWLASPAAGDDFWHPIEALAGATPLRPAQGSWTIVDSHASREAAEAALFATVYKASDGLHARANRQISLRITRWLLPLPVTANAATVAALAVSLLGASVIALASRPAMLFGSALVYVACMLDGVDGEIARLKHLESDVGCWLDTLGDYVFYVVTIAAFGWAVYVRQDFSPFFGFVAIATWLGMLMTLFVLAWQRRSMEEKPDRFHDEVVAAFDTRANSLGYFFLRNTYHFGKRSTMPYYMFAFILLRWEAPLLLLIFLMAQIYWPAALLLGRAVGGLDVVEDLSSSAS